MRGLIAPALAGLTLLPSVALAAAPAPGFRIPVAVKKLANGLTIVVSEDHSAPTFGMSTAFRIGFRLEPKGRTGFAHLFEHMMFEGTPGRPQGHAHPRDRGRRRRAERLHPQRLHELHRLGAGLGARRDPLARGRPDEAPRLLREEPQEPAGGREGGDPGQRQEPALRPLLLDRPRGQGVRQVGEQPRRLRLVRGPRRREPQGRRDLLQELLRTEQRGDGHRRRRHAGGRLRQGREVLRRAALAAAAPAGRTSRRTEHGRADARADGPAGPGARGGRGLQAARPGSATTTWRSWCWATCS